MQVQLSLSYRVVAKRKYYEDRRLPKVKAGIDMFMRPDLARSDLRQLNERWGLKYDGPDMHELPSVTAIPKSEPGH